MLSLKNVKPTSKANRYTFNFLCRNRVLSVPCFFLFFLFCSPAAFSQLSDAEYYNKIDNAVFLYSKKHGHNFDSIARFVNEEFVSSKDKVRALYTWIALNIRYDKELLDRYQQDAGLDLRHLSSLATQNPDTVLKYGEALCEGFSLLMNKFCGRLAIPSRMVIGPTRIEDGEVTDKVLHAWNAVKVDSSWYLLDVTWSNGYVNQMNQYIKKFSDKYFFTAPSEFVKDHWPLDPMWQLSYAPVSKSAFYMGTANSQPVYFNYPDSLAAYMKLKEDTVEYVNFLHYHRFDPANETYTRECDRILHDKLVSYLNLAAVYYDDYQRYANKYNGKTVTEKIVKECIRLLQEPKKYLTSGVAYAQHKSFFHDDIRQNFEKMAASAVENLRLVNASIENHRKFAKAIKGSKK